MNFKVCYEIVAGFGCGFKPVSVVVSAKSAKRARTLARQLLEDKGYIVHAIVSVEPTSEEVTFPGVKPRKYRHENFFLDVGGGTGRRIESAIKKMWKDAREFLSGKICPKCGTQYEPRGTGYPFANFAVIFAVCNCGEYFLPDLTEIPRENRTSAFKSRV